MRQIVKDIWIGRKIFSMLFIGFLLTILPLLIALSTHQYYDKHFYHSKNGVFKYNYVLNFNQIEMLDFANLRLIAKESFQNASVITNGISSSVAGVPGVEVVGLLNQKLWSPAILKGSGIESSNNNEIVVGRLIASEPQSINLWGEEYKIKGIAGDDAGEDLINAYSFKLFVGLNELPESIIQEIKQTDIMQIMVRADYQPDQEIEQFISEVNQRYPETKISTEEITAELNKEKSARGGVNEIMRYPKMLIIIGFINGINISYLWIFLKRKELAIRKAVGASNFSLLSYTWLQLFICAILATIGASILQSFLSQISSLILDTTFYYISFNTAHLVVGFFAAFGISSITSIIPLLQIFRMEPAKAIKE